MAIEDIEKLREKVSRDPNSKLFVPLADEYRKTGNLDEAIAVLVHGIENQPGYMSARVALGKIYLEKNMLPEAQDEFEKVVTAIPDNLFAHKKLAEIYRDTGAVVKARAQYETVLKLNASDEDAMLNLESLRNIQIIEPPPAAPPPEVKEEPVKSIPQYAEEEEIFEMPPVSAKKPVVFGDDFDEFRKSISENGEEGLDASDSSAGSGFDLSLQKAAAEEKEETKQASEIRSEQEDTPFKKTHVKTNVKTKQDVPKAAPAEAETKVAAVPPEQVIEKMPEETVNVPIEIITAAEAAAMTEKMPSVPEEKKNISAKETPAVVEKQEPLSSELTDEQKSMFSFDLYPDENDMAAGVAPDKKGELDSALKDAENNIAMGNYQNAMKLYNKISVSDPGNKQVLQKIEELRMLISMLGPGQSFAVKKSMTSAAIEKMEALHAGLRKRKNEFFRHS